jgi:hypothetical protein
MAKLLGFEGCSQYWEIEGLEDWAEPATSRNPPSKQATMNATGIALE